MALTGKRSVQVEIKSKGDVFHSLWKSKTHQIPNLSPALVKSCQIHDGENGTVGCVVHWNYTLDGKDRDAKTQILDIDEEKKLTTFKIVEGHLLEIYKSFIVHLQVETKGVNNLVTWTIEYEKLSPDVPDPDTFLDMYKTITKDIEANHP